MLFLKRWGKQELDMVAVPKKLIYQDIPRTLLDILSRTMRLQGADGSWESKREVTAYAILTLAPLLSLPWVDFLKPEGIACMYRGKAYLENNRHLWGDAERLWIEKTVYSSSHLSQAYCLAASKVVVPTSFVSQKIVELFPVQLSKKMAKMSGFFSQVIPFCRAPKWKLQLSLLQSASYGAALREARYNIFPPIEKASDEKYQEYIPFTWIGCRDHLSTAISAETLWQMMLVSMFNFQVDAYMETVVWDQYRDRLPQLKAFIRALCYDGSHKRKRDVEDDVGEAPKKAAGTNGVSNGLSKGYPKSTANGAVDRKAEDPHGEHSPKANGASCESDIDVVDAERRIRADSVVSNGNDSVKANGATSLNGNRSDVGDENTQNNGTHKTEEVSEVNGFKKPTAPERQVSQDLEGGAVRTPEMQANDVEEVLAKFVQFALQHPKVLQSPSSLRAWLAHELETFLLAHVTHMEDCAQLAEASGGSESSVTWEQPRTTFFNWVRTTSADHTSCPYSFVFFLCLMGEGGQSIIGNVHQRYALEDACHHLATMCRQYNDFGSVARDQDEKNLNSVNFPEFQLGTSGEEITRVELDERRKRDLLAVAEYERRCLNRVAEELEETLDGRVMEQLKLFIQVTDLYGQIYVARDIGIRRIEEARKNSPAKATTA